MIRPILNHLGQIVGQLELPDETPEAEWLRRLAIYQIPPNPVLEEIQRGISVFQTLPRFREVIMSFCAKIIQEEQLSHSQRLWIHHRLSSVSLTLDGDPIQVDLIHVLLAGDPEMILLVLNSLTPDDFTKPYHALKASHIMSFQQLIQTMAGVAS